MALQPSLPDLAKFLNSFLSPGQINDLISMLNREGSTALDPETASGLNETKPNVEKIAVPASIQDLLKEIDAAYSIDKFPNPSPEDSRRVRDSYPNFIERLSAFQGRHLVKQLRERMNSI
jgi:hypothetical protein